MTASLDFTLSTIKIIQLGVKMNLKSQISSETIQNNNE